MVCSHLWSLGDFFFVFLTNYSEEMIRGTLYVKVGKPEKKTTAGRQGGSNKVKCAHAIYELEYLQKLKIIQVRVSSAVQWLKLRA